MSNEIARTTNGGVPAVRPNIAADTFAPMEGFDKDSLAGKEGITSEDLRLPYLSIAQKTSKAIDETDDAYIDGLKLGELYNSETKEIYGRGPIQILPLRHAKRAYLPDENGRMGESIAWNDTRCAWPTEDQKRSWTSDGKKGKPKPEGVRCYDWVVLILGEGGPQLAVITFKSKSFAAGQSLTTFVSMIQGPSFTGKFDVKSNLTENTAGKFGQFAVVPAGKPTTEEAKFAAAIYASIKDRKIVPQDDAVEDGAEEADAPQPQTATRVPADKIPF